MSKINEILNQYPTWGAETEDIYVMMEQVITTSDAKEAMQKYADYYVKETLDLLFKNIEQLDGKMFVIDINKVKNINLPEHT